MSKIRQILGAILGAFMYLVLVVLIAVTLYVPPKDIRPVITWFFLGLVPLIVTFGQYMLLKNEKLKRGIKLGLCGYILWLFMLILLKLISFEIDEYHSTLVGYAIILAIVILGRKAFSR